MTMGDTMSAQILDINEKNIEKLNKLLVSLKKQEAEMRNPLLGEWFAIRNRMRAIEKRIKELKNAKNY